MKSITAILAAVIAHAVLIGLLMGMSRSPVVGAVLPLLLGVGGYRILDGLLGTQKPPSDDRQFPQWSPRLGWAVVLWCVVVVASVFAGISLRNGVIRVGPQPVKTISYVSLDAQSPERIAQLALICTYYDRLEMSAEQRKALGRALSNPELDAYALLASLQNLLGTDARPSTEASSYGVFEYRVGGAP